MTHANGARTCHRDAADAASPNPLLSAVEVPAVAMTASAWRQQPARSAPAFAKTGVTGPSAAQNNNSERRR
jgi:hypothetical protein